MTLFPGDVSFYRICALAKRTRQHQELVSSSAISLFLRRVPQKIQSECSCFSGDSALKHSLTLTWLSSPAMSLFTGFVRQPKNKSTAFIQWVLWMVWFSSITHVFTGVGKDWQKKFLKIKEIISKPVETILTTKSQSHEVARSLCDPSGLRGFVVKRIIFTLPMS